MMLSCVHEVLSWMGPVSRSLPGDQLQVALFPLMEEPCSQEASLSREAAPLASVLYMNRHIKAFTACLEEALRNEAVRRQYDLQGDFKQLRRLWRGTTPEGFSGQTCTHLQVVCFPRYCGMADLEGNFACPGRFTVACTRATTCLSIHLPELARTFHKNNKSAAPTFFWNKLIQHCEQQDVNATTTVKMPAAQTNDKLSQVLCRVTVVRLTKAPPQELRHADEGPTDIVSGLEEFMRCPLEPQKGFSAQKLTASSPRQDPKQWSKWHAGFLEHCSRNHAPTWPYGCIPAPFVWLKSGSTCQICLYYSFPFVDENLRTEALKWLQVFARQLFSEAWDTATTEFKIRAHKREVIRTVTGAEMELKHCHEMREELVGRDPNTRGKDSAFMYIGGGDYGPPYSVGVVHKGLTFQRGAKLLAIWAQRSGKETPPACIIPDPNRLHLRKDHLKSRVEMFVAALSEATVQLQDTSGPSSRSSFVALPYRQDRSR